MKTRLQLLSLSTFVALGSLLLGSCAHEPVTKANASQANARQIARDSREALDRLYAENPAARKIGRNSARFSNGAPVSSPRLRRPEHEPRLLLAQHLVGRREVHPQAHADVRNLDLLGGR